MADFTALKTAIQNAIKQNGNEEITGNLLQDVLLAIVTTLGDSSINDLITALGSEATTRSQADGTLQQNIDAEAQARGNADTALGGRIDGVISSIEAINNAIENGYVYAGIATPSSTPTTGKVFYLALTAGTYTNFGSLVITQGINILKYNGTAWSLDAFVGIDDTPTPSSNNLVKSGGVFNDIMTNGSAFDLSAYNNGTTYADLNAALTALNALPAAYKKSGMSMKYVHTSDNKYVQYRLMTQTFSTNTTDWQGVDDEPKNGSDNLVKSGGVADKISQLGQTSDQPKMLFNVNIGDFVYGGYYRSTDGAFVESDSRHLTDFIEVTAGEILDVNILCFGATIYGIVAFDADYNLIPSASVVPNGQLESTYTIPQGVKYLRFCEGGSSETHIGSVQFPDSIISIKKSIDDTRLNYGLDFLNRLSPNKNCQILYIKTNFPVTRMVLKRIYNANDGFRFWVDVYEQTHTSTAWNVQINEVQNVIKTGFYEAVLVYGAATIKVGLYFWGEVIENNLNIEIPLSSIEQSFVETINDISNLQNELGEILSNSVRLEIGWKEGRLDYNSGTYTGWTDSDTYCNSGYIKLPKGNYKIKGLTTPNNRAPLVIAYNDDYTFNQILIAGSDVLTEYDISLATDTIVAFNTQVSAINVFELVKNNVGELDICKNFSDVDDQLYYKGQPIASDLSNVIVDLPVSDGTGIQSGYAYIDNIDRTIKVKA